jgi:hypothetical protein
MALGHQPKVAACQCGQTAIELTGAPILSATCYCESCRTAGHGFERDLGAPQTVNASGGVDYCSYRKDRVTIVRGAQHLQEFRLKPVSPTRRVVAGCCSSPMFVDYTPGHWLTIFRDRLAAPAPKSQMLLMTKDKLEGAVLPSDIPVYATMPPSFMFKLIGSWAAMGFRRPKIVW